MDWNFIFYVHHYENIAKDFCLITKIHLNSKHRISFLFIFKDAETTECFEQNIIKSESKPILLAYTARSAFPLLNTSQATWHAFKKGELTHGEREKGHFRLVLKNSVVGNCLPPVCIEKILPYRTLSLSDRQKLEFLRKTEDE